MIAREFCSSDVFPPSWRARRQTSRDELSSAEIFPPPQSYGIIITGIKREREQSVEIISAMAKQGFNNSRLMAASLPLFSLMQLSRQCIKDPHYYYNSQSLVCY
jgi:hypothetical protein